MTDELKLAIANNFHTDTEKAAAYRTELTPILDKCCEILQRSRADGFIISFNISPDQYGRHRIQAIDITKPL